MCETLEDEYDRRNLERILYCFEMMCNRCREKGGNSKPQHILLLERDKKAFTFQLGASFEHGSTDSILRKHGRRDMSECQYHC